MLPPRKPSLPLSQPHMQSTHTLSGHPRPRSHNVLPAGQDAGLEGDGGGRAAGGVGDLAACSQGKRQSMRSVKACAASKHA